MLASVYGFKNECIAKTSDHIFTRICTVFPLLPLACVIPEVGFVVHGGLSSMERHSIEAINEVPRRNWDTVSQAGVALEDLSEDDRRHFLLMKDLLWSDVDPNMTGTVVSPRGAGCVFGPDVAEEWLEEENLPHLIRSHYCIPQGIDKLECENGGHNVYTVFSCSNYVNSGNNGSVVTFSKDEQGEVQAREYTYYTPYEGTSDAVRTGRPVHGQRSLVSVLTQHQDVLNTVLEYFDLDGDGKVSREVNP